ncbi:deoxyribonuclease TATDN1-like protein (macronuclear) [Tetrahymena thermophila SB210]|uniref:Deoxyribonuclease TATDN1-like protein n=1 Tax=Tetrahymena thermophila (strain SB210) TaxID=312017 RepID=A4VCZ9_TETTS|nr:deoxyribonuclease TATDN1-like protein [Tetrahymena thermophila SB210]EDK31409.2 deoxyribonuclease TATDN1-like protein [Tetrahymena thermophila SB210]|eukprot:XP_001471004.2 deoxyribonuclease TATDN1-like protein [Tetrahymena thermophila SB210]
MIKNLQKLYFATINSSKFNKMEAKHRFFDIAANLADHTFKGHYYEKKVHDEDVDEVIQRAASIGCDRLLIVGGYIEDSIESYKICQKSNKFYCTVGVHPCRANEVEANGRTQEDYFKELDELISKHKDKCVAVGECGLDYDRFDYASKETQLKHFEPHFNLAEKYNLPMYLHNRNTGNDFFDIVRRNRKRFPTGVVHSFTGTEEELKQILELDLYVGINGCSLRDEASLEIVKKIPLDKIQIETDAPYCEIRNTHPGRKFVKTVFEQKKKEKFVKGFMVKGRNEPCQIIQVLEVLAGVLGKDEKELSEICYKNTLKMFNLKDE